jgi:hypothetical protein
VGLENITGKMPVPHNPRFESGGWGVLAVVKKVRYLRVELLSVFYAALPMTGFAECENMLKTFPMLLALLLIGLLFTAAVAFTVTEARQAPIAYEDREGFHFGSGRSDDDFLDSLD